ncbi:MAG: 4-hydroxythreonine-4-phosphate dehydrogenase PdxA [Gammaproteobacteria bacterium]
MQPTSLALTPGEPAGIGPDLALALATGPLAAELIAIADADMLAARARILGLAVTIDTCTADAPRTLHRPGHLRCLHVAAGTEVRAGVADARNAHYVLQTLRAAAGGCLRGRFDAMVTGPVHKGIINDAGEPFSGHTEFLAGLTGAAHPVMLMNAPGLRVALATTHLPLSQVPGAITPTLLETVLEVLTGDLRRWFGVATPRVLVCGLNPHAGEGGYLGTEERDVIAPTLARLRMRGLDLRGPVPADTAFVPASLAEVDAVLTMYHDQGLPVVKHRSFDEAVNVTLGLPIVRTSVDHGTALDLAATGRASPASLRAAIATALAMASFARARA